MHVGAWGLSKNLLQQYPVCYMYMYMDIGQHKIKS